MTAAIDPGQAKSPGGTFVTPRGIPASVATTIPSRMAPGTLRICSATTTARPIRATIAPGAAKLPRAKALTRGFTTTSPALRNPSVTIKMPSDADRAILTSAGTTRITTSRSPASVSTRNNTPDQKAMAMPVCQRTPSVSASVPAMTAGGPSPGPTTNGRRA